MVPVFVPRELQQGWMELLRSRMAEADGDLLPGQPEAAAEGPRHAPSRALVAQQKRAAAMASIAAQRDRRSSQRASGAPRAPRRERPAAPGLPSHRDQPRGAALLVAAFAGERATTAGAAPSQHERQARGSGLEEGSQDAGAPRPRGPHYELEVEVPQFLHSVTKLDGFNDHGVRQALVDARSFYNQVTRREDAMGVALQHMPEPPAILSGLSGRLGRDALPGLPP